MDYYKRYMGDYARDTGHLSLAAHGAFTVLLDHYYSKREPLPASLEELYRLCRAMSKQEQAAVNMVAMEFFPVGSDGRRHNERADKEIKKWEELSQEASESGKRGAQVRWGKQSKGEMANPMSTPSKNDSQPHSEPNGVGHENPNGVSMALQLHSQKPNPLPEPNPTPEPELERRTRSSRPRDKPVSAAKLLSASRNSENTGESEAENLKRVVLTMLQSGSTPAEVARAMPSRRLTEEQVREIGGDAS